MLLPFLLLLGAIIPPVGGVIMADYWVRYKGQYPLLNDVELPNFNWNGLIAYSIGAIVAYNSPWIAPIVGIVVASGCYVMLIRLFPAKSAKKSAQVMTGPSV